MVTQELNIARVYGATWLTVINLLVFSSCSQKELDVPYYNTPDLSPTWSADHEKQVHKIAAFEFTNQDGEAYGSKDLDGKVYVANFFFTSCPSICPKMTNNLKVVADYFQDNKDFAVVSFSVTPDIDSASRLKDYHKGKGLTEGWNLLTGNQADIYKLSRQSFFVEEEIGFNKDSSDFLHTERCVLVDTDKHIRGVYNATVALDMERLIEDVNVLLGEPTSRR